MTYSIKPAAGTHEINYVPASSPKATWLCLVLWLIVLGLVSTAHCQSSHDVIETPDANIVVDTICTSSGCDIDAGYMTWKEARERGKAHAEFAKEAGTWCKANGLKKFSSSWSKDFDSKCVTPYIQSEEFRKEAK